MFRSFCVSKAKLPIGPEEDHAICCYYYCYYYYQACTCQMKTYIPGIMWKRQSLFPRRWQLMVTDVHDTCCQSLLTDPDLYLMDTIQPWNQESRILDSLLPSPPPPLHLLTALKLRLRICFPPWESAWFSMESLKAPSRTISDSALAEAGPHLWRLLLSQFTPQTQLFKCCWSLWTWFSNTSLRL